MGIKNSSMDLIAFSVSNLSLLAGREPDMKICVVSSLGNMVNFICVMKNQPEYTSNIISTMKTKTL